MYSLERVLGILSGLTIGAAQITYLSNTISKKITPSVLSWFGWACLMGTSLFSQIVSEGWQWSMTGVACSTAGCLAISATALLSRNFSFKRNDLWFVAAGLVCVFVYFGSDSAWITTVFAVIADLLLGIPTFIKAYKSPASERSAAWMLGVVSSTFALLACVHHDLIFVLFPAYLFLFNGAMVFITRK